MTNKIHNTKQGAMGKILIPILLVLVIVGIWVFKNLPEQPEEVTANSIEVTQSENDAENIEEIIPIDITSIKGYFSLEVTEALDLDKLKSYGLPIMIDFGADDCIPCKEMAPVLAKLNEELAGKAIVLFVDVWKYQDFMEGYPVEVIPTQIFIDGNGNPYIPSENQQAQFIQYSLRDTNEHVFTAHQGGMTEAEILEALEEMGMER